MGAGFPFTVTVTRALEGPALPVTVTIYTVVYSGDTVADPLTGTSPIPLSIKAFSAPDDVQDRTDDPPFSILKGEAPILTGAWEGFTVIVTSAVFVPPGPPWIPG
ncbi:MAG: hypothetical protein GY795_31040 [Desulfobacterales bacterium]|nr:hypothetical protein [Desulfobacterales bacterium]